MTARPLLIALSAFAVAAAATPALAQYKPPHWNDPHPPANQPSYQLPSSPLARPGLPGYPGAPHFNDPHYRRTEPRIEWPRDNPPNYSPNPTLGSSRPPYSYTPPAVVERRGGKRRAAGRPPSAAERTISIEQCYRNWDPGTRMSRTAWNSTCRRLAVNGRVGLW
jgi:hypothetical protein